MGPERIYLSNFAPLSILLENEKASFEYAQHLMNAAMIDPSKSADYAREAADVLGPLHNRLAAQEGVLASKYWVHVPLYYARALQLSNESTSSPATLLNFNDEYMDKVVLKLYKNWYNNARKIKDEIRLKNNQDLYSTWMAVGRHFGSKRSKTPA